MPAVVFTLALRGLDALTDVRAFRTSVHGGVRLAPVCVRPGAPVADTPASEQYYHRLRHMPGRNHRSTHLALEASEFVPSAMTMLSGRSCIGPVSGDGALEQMDDAIHWSTSRLATITAPWRGVGALPLAVPSPVHGGLSIGLLPEMRGWPFSVSISLAGPAAAQRGPGLTGVKMQTRATRR